MIIFDLDGTLADCEHRRHYVDINHVTNKKLAFERGDITWDDYQKNWKPDWKSFFEACDKDEPIDPTIDALTHLSDMYEIQIWSGRCESVQKKTEEWLEDRYLLSYHVDVLKMRPNL